MSAQYLYRDYDAKIDANAVIRIWQECGWIEEPSREGVFVKEFFESAEHALVALINNDAECAVHSTPGTMRYLNESLSMGAITAVTTSRVARRLGFAKDLTARLLVKQAKAGYDISALGMFEQGFYDKLGFGTGSYDQWIEFDPASLLVNNTFRPPTRLQIKDYEAIFDAGQRRSRIHGGVTIDSKLGMKSELNFTENAFGLGYFDGPNNSLSHFIWGSCKDEHGPFEITIRAYENPDQLMELLALIKSLGDQINQVSTLEFGEIQLQDLIKQPFRQRRASAKGNFAHTSESFAYWQARILNIESCLAKTKLNTPTLRFNLILTDPVTDCLPADADWLGIAGEYVITLGSQSSGKAGLEEGLMTLHSSVNAFTRMWLGVRPATSLTITTDLSGPMALLQQLDESLAIPRPHLGWDF